MATMPVAPFDVPTKADVAVELETFASEEAGLEGVRPAGWAELAPGQFMRGASATDPTSLLQISLPLPLDEAQALLADRFGLTDPPEPIDTVDVGGLEWNRYGTEAQGVAIDYAAASTGEATLIVVLTSPPSARDQLIEAVLLPAIEGLRPLSAGAG